MIEITCKDCVHTEPTYNDCGIDYGYAFDHEKLDFDCGDCQREDAPCDNCTRNENNKDKEDPDLEDLYFHEVAADEY